METVVYMTIIGDLIAKLRYSLFQSRKLESFSKKTTGPSEKIEE